MVKILDQHFVGNIKNAGHYVTTFELTGEITVAEAKKNDELTYWTQGYGFNSGSVVINKATKQEVGRIYLVEVLHDKELSHDSDNPPTTSLHKYIVRFTNDVEDGTTIYTYYDGQTNTSMSKTGYTIDFWVKEGENKENDVLTTPVQIPPKPSEPEVTGINMVFTNVTYIEGEWDGNKRTGIIVQAIPSLPVGTLFEIEFPKDHLVVTDEVKVGKVYTAGSQSYTTESAKVNSHNVYQKDPKTLDFEVVSVDGNKVVFKNLRPTEPSNKYVIDVGGDVWIKSLKYVYELENTTIDGVVKGDIKDASGKSISNSAQDSYTLSHLRTKKNTSADTPYKGEDDTPKEEEPPKPQPTPTPIPTPDPVPAPPCLDCDVCESCECQPADILGSNTESQLRNKLMVLYGTICAIANANCLDLPRLLAKFAFLVWCLLSDIVDQIVALQKLHNK